MKTILGALAILPLSFTPAVADQSAIKGTINSQFEAFKTDDFETAFTFASPTLQRLFQTPQNFGRMVTQGYPMVWRPAQVQYLELREDVGVFFQKVMITDQSGGLHVLEYRMQQTENGWRISGVQILDAPGASV
ncbi:DUF4864 domain-containing protein [Sulfitobacter sp. S190]|uniref:DUF4864 domain-containing protein n=1 Tax=Sulfitobacter sp. S190 TaxID=2867022 RepID=UPI0021A2868F|nr:DUF4864 domain-containing protein [Sulfitobacter sp. S190]UWR22036.1 DUF4864 domain-containing protein [Sulfitobacter sp. S190]